MVEETIYYSGKIMSSRVNALILSFIGMQLSLPVQAADLYRWTDEKGDVHYTDRVPPEYVKQGYRVISEQGLTIKTIRSVEEMLNSEKEKKAESTPQQTEQDRILLMTYSSEAEILAMRKRKLADIESLLKLNQETISLFETQFRELTRQASDYEKQGKEIPDELRSQLDNISARIKQHQSLQLQHQQDMLDQAKKFDQELARYQQLTKPAEEPAKGTISANEPPSTQDSAKIDELISTNKNQQKKLASMISLQEEAISALDFQFRELVQKAEEFKHQDQKIPQDLYEKITSTKNDLIRHHGELLEKKKKLTDLKKELQDQLELLQLQKKMNIQQQDGK
jgi:hypothetical protein